MSIARYQAVADGVFCIETGLYRDGLAACYLIREQDRLACVDTGTTHTVPGLLGVIEDLGLTPAHVDYVIPTHVHLDHASGAGVLMAACPNATLVAHPKAAPHLIDPARLTAGATAVYGEAAFARDFGELVAVPEDRVIAAGDGQRFDLAGRNLTFIDTPGHANHHGCIHDAGSGGIFTGDTFGISYREFDTAAGPWLFAPTTPVAFDPDAWQRSLDRLLDFAPAAAFLTHYCRIDEPARHVERLRRSINDLAAMALEQADPPGPERKDRIKDAITAHLLADARAHGCTLSDARMAELLSVDLELNAQGLDVWLKRREKRGG
ncbi:MBL fold metallo-hydrolase [Thiohalocapsa halophila]|uniref:MBL fold metallo-hydrolase n=1 Tax=Thiohalocapsa halophila TaxID=69359 RepID=A0ABS1CQU0_9GAMM|nr:MBL fold metallo-hydrolase [Thiohalocapsa halophila]MBK1633864.1 MBL fold metallo-hydrolase [Thiohalocapsa halophila]